MKYSYKHKQNWHNEHQSIVKKIIIVRENVTVQQCNKRNTYLFETIPLFVCIRTFRFFQARVRKELILTHRTRF